MQLIGMLDNLRIRLNSVDLIIRPILEFLGGRQSEADNPPILGKNIRLSSTGGGPSDIRQSSDPASEPICCDHQVTSSQSNKIP